MVNQEQILKAIQGVWSRILPPNKQSGYIRYMSYAHETKNARNVNSVHNCNIWL